MYAVVSDQHAHKWSQFATTTSSGVNSRLQHMLDEMLRAAKELLAAGGDCMVFSGDLFHTRGSIDPEVFNPVAETIKMITDSGIHIYAIPGNHDLASRDTSELSNAMQSLHANRFTVITKPVSFIHTWSPHKNYRIAFIPWMSKLDDVRAAAEELRIKVHAYEKADLFIHAGIEGVIEGLDHGLSAKEVASWGFRRVFAGHYHNHKVMQDGKVISIGALTHQTFSDVGTKAGFLLVDDKSITYRASHAPSFVDIDGSTPEEEIPLRADGNFVRVRGMTLTDAQVNMLRKELIDMGAKGVTIQVARELVSARSLPAASGMRLEDSISKYIDSLGLSDPDTIKEQAERILMDVRSATT